MRTMIRRLQRLEARASMQRNEQGETPADVLQTRIRLQCEADGVPFQDTPPEEFSGGQGRSFRRGHSADALASRGVTIERAPMPAENGRPPIGFASRV